MSVAKIILNPYARCWAARERIPEIEQILRAANTPFELVQTEAPGHGIEVAAQAVRAGYTPIIAAGGDSTINEVVNGMMQVWAEWMQTAAPDESPSPESDSPAQRDLPPLGILPLGTANDLAADLGLPATLAEALTTIHRGKTRRIDVGQCNQRYFVNNAGIGMEAYAGYQQSLMPDSKRSTSRYMQAALKTIVDMPSWEMDIFWENGRYHGPVSLISVGNGTRTGGMFYLTPEADPFDGSLDFTIGYLKGRLSAIRHLLMSMRPHNALDKSNQIYTGRGTSLRVISSTPTFLHTDGEIFQEQTEMHFRIHPAALPILI
ncbi:MAG: diacylglycerol kinase family lipid kinase [Anaerolineales bacterium]